MEQIKSVTAGVAECCESRAKVDMDSLGCYMHYTPSNLGPFVEVKACYVDKHGKLCVDLVTGCNTHPDKSYEVTLQYRNQHWVFMTYSGMTEYYDMNRWSNPRVEVGFSLVMAFGDFLRGLDEAGVL